MGTIMTSEKPEEEFVNTTEMYFPRLDLPIYSLSYLHMMLPVEKIPKGERSWLRQLPDNKENDLVAQSVIGWPVQFSLEEEADLLPSGKEGRACLLYSAIEMHKYPVGYPITYANFYNNLIGRLPSLSWSKDWRDPTIKPLYPVMSALIMTTFSMFSSREEEKTDASGDTIIEEVILTKRIHLSKAVDLSIFDVDNPNSTYYFPPYFLPSDDFRALIPNPIPLDIDAWVKLYNTCDSALALDLYIYFAHQAPLAPPEGHMLTWEHLYNQFSVVCPLKEFIAQVKDNMPLVRRAYPGLKVRLSGKGITLKCSPAVKETFIERDPFAPESL